MTQFVNPDRAADMALKERNVEVFTWVAGNGLRAKEQPVGVSSEPSSVTTPPPVVTVPATSSLWDCIATAETGGDYSMHGSTYSTAFGMVNDIIYEYGTPEEQSAVFSGTATKAQEIDIASRFAADHGFGGWGALTRQKCSL
jgi:hypothetical protein